MQNINIVIGNSIIQKTTSVPDQGANGRTMITPQTGGITIKILPRDLVSSLVNHIVQTIQTVEHSNGHGIIVRGGGGECVRINRTLQWKTPLFGLAEKKVHSNRNINSHFFL